MMTDGNNLPVPVKPTDPDEESEPSLRATVLAGLVIVVLFFGAFSGWSLFADLDSAVVASGSVVVDSNRKTVQHLEGGILKALHVREGDRVTAGQLIAEIDSVQAGANLGQIASQYWSLKARIARLRSEQNGERAVVFPAEIAERLEEPAIADAMRAQERLFNARWRAHDDAITILRTRIEQREAEVEAERSMLKATGAQRALTTQELGNVERLYKKGYERLPRLLQLKSKAAELRGKESNIRGRIAKWAGEIAGARAEISSTMNTRLAKIGEKLQEALVLEANLADRLRAAADVMDRSAIHAPQDGVVVGLKFFTAGGVIAPGQAILDIVPSNDSLVIEAKVLPADIDVIRVGQGAQVWLTAYKRTDVPPVDGEVIHVSADQLTDSRSGEAFFSARVKIDVAALAALENVTLQPGMPAEVMIVTGERRALDYFIGPLKDRMRHAFREQ